MNGDLASLRPHLRAGEQILWSARPSLLGLVPITLSTLAAAAATFGPRYIGWEHAPPAGVLAASASFLFAFLGLLIEFGRRFVRLKFTTFVITPERFYSVTSFFTTTVRSVPLSRVTLVTLHQGLIARVFGLWTARIVAYGEAGATLEVPAIPDGERLLAEASNGLTRGSNAAWILRGD